MADDHRDDADNEITRIVQRPGPRQVPVQVGPVQVGPRPPAAPPHQPPPVNPPAPRLPASPFAQAPGAVPPFAPTPVAVPGGVPRSPLQASDDPDATRVAPRPAAPAPAPPRAGLTPPRPLSPSPISPSPVPSPVAPAPIAPIAVAPAAAPQPVAPAAPPAAVDPVVVDERRVMTVPKAMPRVEPVVGWLVVIKGPGRGAARELVKGRNSLGSDADQLLVIDFGDPAIARRGHVFIVYDEEGREFFIEDGKQKEVVRLNGRLLTETRQLSHGDEIRIGATTFRFVALCGADFDWSEEAAAKPPAVEPEPTAPAAEAMVKGDDLEPSESEPELPG